MITLHSQKPRVCRRGLFFFRVFRYFWEVFHEPVWVEEEFGNYFVGCNHRHSGNQLNAQMLIELAANDYIQLGFASGSGGAIQGSTPRNYFWGYLVG